VAEGENAGDFCRKMGMLPWWKAAKTNTTLINYKYHWPQWIWSCKPLISIKSHECLL
jgi:hypothetical protein